MFLNILIVLIVIFVSINFYSDIRNAINTGHSFIENMTDKDASTSDQPNTETPAKPETPATPDHTHPTMYFDSGILKEFTTSVNDMFYNYFKSKSEFNNKNYDNGMVPWRKNTYTNYKPYVENIRFN